MERAICGETEEEVDALLIPLMREAVEKHAHNADKLVMQIHAMHDETKRPLLRTERIMLKRFMFLVLMGMPCSASPRSFPPGFPALSPRQETFVKELRKLVARRVGMDVELERFVEDATMLFHLS